MEFPSLDRSKCRKDGICTRACPNTFLRLDDDGFPKTREDEGQSCIECGHCVSVCPHGALSLGSTPVEKLEALGPSWRLDFETASRFLKGRRSVRVFREEPLSREEITQLIEVAQYAPSAHNSQPVEWGVISDRADVRKVAEGVIEWMRRAVAENHPFSKAYDLNQLVRGFERGTDTICRNAPHLVVAHAPKKMPTGPGACTLSLAYLELAAVSMNAGACWSGFTLVAAVCSPEVATMLRVPEGRQCSGVVMLGRPATQHVRLPPRKAPKITWL